MCGAGDSDALGTICWVPNSKIQLTTGTRFRVTVLRGFAEQGVRGASVRGAGDSNGLGSICCQLTTGTGLRVTVLRGCAEQSVRGANN